MAQLKVVNIRDSSGTLIKTLSRLPSERDLRDLLAREFGYGLYKIAFRDGSKPVRKSIVIDEFTNPGLSSRDPENQNSRNQIIMSGNNDGYDHALRMFDDRLRVFEMTQRQIAEDIKNIIEFLNHDDDFDYDDDDMSGEEEEQKEDSGIFDKIAGKILENIGDKI